MKFLNLFKKQKPVIETKAQTSELIWPLQEGSFLEYAMGLGGRVTANMAMNFYRTNSTVATAVDKIANKIEQITPVLKTSSGDIVTKHPVLDLLKCPNPFNTYQQFIGKLSRHYLLKHDSHVALLGNINRPPLELYAVKPQNVSTVQAVDYFPGSYYVTVGPGVGSYARVDSAKTVRFIDGDFKEFFHIMGFSSRSSDLQGDSLLEAAALETKQQIKGRLHNLSVLDNGGRLSLIVAFKDPDGIDGDEHNRRKKRIYEDLSGSENSGKIAVVSGEEVNITEAGISNKDMDFAELDNVASKAIYQRFEIPLPLVTTDATTYNNYQTALLDFYENVVLPNTDILFSGLSKSILPRYGIDDLKLSYDPESIKALIRQQLDELKQRKEIAVETTNELRTFLPRRESIAGGDVLYQPATLVPIGEDLYTGDELTAEELEAMNRE